MRVVGEAAFAFSDDSGQRFVRRKRMDRVETGAHLSPTLGARGYTHSEVSFCGPRCEDVLIVLG